MPAHSTQPGWPAATVWFWSTLVKAIAVRVRENLPVHVDLDDLVHAGILGLVDAANTLNPKKHAVFSSYAKHRVKAVMLE